MKKLKGFTLIELIVVISILGVLLAILVPTMMGWLTKSKISSYNSDASEVYNQLSVFMADLDAQGKSLDNNCSIVYDRGAISGVTDNELKTSLLKFNGNLMDMTNVAWAAKIENGSLMAVSLSKDINLTVVGGYPVPCPRESSYHMKGGAVEDYIDAADGKVEWNSLKAE